MQHGQAMVAADEGRMTWQEIHERFPDEWVVVADVEGHLGVSLSGRVVAHDPRRAAAYAAAVPFLVDVMHSASFFTGRSQPVPYPIRWLR